MGDSFDHDDDDAFLRGIGSSLRAPERADATFEARVMSAAHAEMRARAARTASRSTASWWRRDRTISLSPVAGLATAASLLILLTATDAAVRMALQSASPPRVATAPVPSRPSAPMETQVVRFELHAPDASSIALVGDFNDWSKNATPLAHAPRPGVWTVTLTLPRGRHEYAFVVHALSGERWVADPIAPVVHDEFGTVTSVVDVGRAGMNARPDAS